MEQELERGRVQELEAVLVSAQQARVEEALEEEGLKRLVSRRHKDCKAAQHCAKPRNKLHLHCVNLAQPP